MTNNTRSVVKHVRRRSNWYIYLLTFIITAVVLCAVVWSMRDILFATYVPDSGNTGAADYRPGKEFNATILLMLSEMKGGTPEFFALANYRPRDDTAIIVPLPKNTQVVLNSRSMTLADAYGEGGAKGVNTAIRDLLGVSGSFYVKFDRLSFIDLANQLGTTTLSIPYDLTGGAVEFRTGSATLTGDQLYQYITYPTMPESDRLVTLASSVVKMVNANTRDLSAGQLQEIFSKVINGADTDFDFEDFTSNQSAYLYTCGNSPDFTEYYMPYGDTDGDGRFVLADGSIETILERFEANDN